MLNLRASVARVTDPLGAWLLRRGATVRAYDPVAVPGAREVFADMPGITFVDSQSEALVRSDALLIVTDWKEFRSPDYARMKALMREAVIFDGRNILDPAEARATGFAYTGIGRP